MNITEWIAAQPRLLTSDLTRLDVADLEEAEIFPPVSADVLVRIWRNYACEPMEHVFRLVCTFWGINAKFDYSPYDDSFSFIGWTTPPPGAVEVLLIDRKHYFTSDSEFSEWLAEREARFEKVSGSKPITVVLSDDIRISVDGVEVSRLEPKSQTKPFFDSRYEKATGSRLTPHAHSVVARELACSWIPESVVAPKKLIVMDLDNTMHRGILGEIGMDVHVDVRAKELQEEMLRAKHSGFLLAIASKNDASDVERLLDEHPDYLIRRKDLVALQANWKPKFENLGDILELVRVGSDSVIFVDDNPAELILMASAFPKVTLVAAGEDVDAHETLRLVPGYRRSRTDDLADTRIRDLLTNQEREALIHEGLSEYFLTARPVLSVSVNDQSKINRLVDLGLRSNQFNLVLHRSTLTDFTVPGRTAVALSLADKFSDSGVIGGILLENSDSSTLKLLDLFLSCRVLGRELETPLIAAGLLASIDLTDTEEVEIVWTIGERNEPALTWLGHTFLNAAPSTAGSLRVSRNILSELAATPKGVNLDVSY
jgi:FkbH-like protein